MNGTNSNNMTKIRLLLTVVAVFVFTGIKAQSEYYDYFDVNTYWINTDPVYKQQNKEIKQIQVVYKRAKKNKTHTQISHYNENGKLIELSEINKKGIEVPRIKETYDQYGNEASLERFKKGKLRSTTVFTRQPTGEILSFEKRNKKGILIDKGAWRFNADNNLIETVQYKKHGTKIRRRWVYEYYAKNKRSKSTLYKGNGKVKNIWTYDCKEEGEKLTAKKNETQVCHWQQSSADYLTYVFQTFDEKGRIVKYITKFTAKDTLPVEHLEYDKNDKLRFKRTFDKSFQKPLSHCFYKRDKLNYEAKYAYKDSLQTSYESFSKGVMLSKHEFTYNEKNLLDTQKWYGKKNKLQTTKTLTYTYRQ